MKGFLLDTHTFLWVVFDDTRLRRSARALLFDAPLFLSIASAAEIAIKSSIGKLALPSPFQTNFSAAFQATLKQAAIDLIPLEMQAVEHLRSLPRHHRDPFDRIIIAQALASGLAVATRDSAFSAYDGLEILEV